MDFWMIVLDLTKIGFLYFLDLLGLKVTYLLSSMEWDWERIWERRVASWDKMSKTLVWERIDLVSSWRQGDRAPEIWLTALISVLLVSDLFLALAFSIMTLPFLLSSIIYILNLYLPLIP